MEKLPKVVVVGRANVGKSTLFNRLSTTVKSLILDYEGVTRDFIKDRVEWNGRTFELIDTGGIQLTKSEDPLRERVRLLALQMLDAADVVLFMCDGSISVTAQDVSIAKMVRKLDKKTFLVLNKSDVKKSQEHLFEFERLGFKNIIPVSAQHGIGTGDLLNAIIEVLPPIVIEQETLGVRVVLLGKPNVGKSSLMNALLQTERSLVADIPGTTREAISETLRISQETIQLTDTAGVRARGSIEETLEELMVKSSLQAVRDADVVLLLVDAHEGKISHQELKLASFVFETGKALIIVRNKDDLLNPEIKETWKMDFEEYEHLFKKLETITISCKTGHNIGQLLPLVQTVWKRYQLHISMSELTVFFKNHLEQTPLYKNKQKLKVFSAKQVGVNPPTIRLNVNETQWFETSQLGFFENCLRKAYPLKGVPIKFLTKRIKFN